MVAAHPVMASAFSGSGAVEDLTTNDGKRCQTMQKTHGASPESNSYTARTSTHGTAKHWQLQANCTVSHCFTVKPLRMQIAFIRLQVPLHYLHYSTASACPAPGTVGAALRHMMQQYYCVCGKH
jgi:hypothetical protein